MDGQTPPADGSRFRDASASRHLSPQNGNLRSTCVFGRCSGCCCRSRQRGAHSVNAAAREHMTRKEHDLVRGAGHHIDAEKDLEVRLRRGAAEATQCGGEPGQAGEEDTGRVGRLRIGSRRQNKLSASIEALNRCDDRKGPCCPTSQDNAGEAVAPHRLPLRGRWRRLRCRRMGHARRAQPNHAPLELDAVSGDNLLDSVPQR